MKVILTADVKGTGKKGDVVEVNDGFGKNFLIKKGLATVATASGINETNQKKNAELYHKAEQVKAMQALASSVNGKQVELFIKLGANGKPFGSVTSQDVSDALKKLGFDIDKKKIQFSPVKALGLFDADIRLMENVTAKIKVQVSPLQ